MDEKPTERQIAFLKKLLDERGMKCNNIQDLSRKAISNLIKKLMNMELNDGQPIDNKKHFRDTTHTELKICHGMIFKLVHQKVADSNGNIPTSKEEVFKTVVANMCRLYRESFGNVSVMMQRNKDNRNNGKGREINPCQFPIS